MMPFSVSAVGTSLNYCWKLIADEVAQRWAAVVVLGVDPPARKVQHSSSVERRAVADLDRHASTVPIHLHPERVRFVEIERLTPGIERSEDGHRLTRGEHMTTHVALRTQMLPRSQYSPECLLPIPHRLAIYPYNDIPDNRRSDPFVGQGKVNVGRIAAVEFEDGPHRGNHLLALHVGGISRNTQSTESDKGRDDRVISAGAARLRLFRHGADLIGSWVYVNYPGGSASPCSSRRRFTHNRRERSKPR
jgi:hypothetical protein